MRSIHTAVLKFEIFVPFGSAAALADQIGSRYQVAPTKGLSTRPLLVVEVVLELEELLLEELLLDEELEAPELEEELLLDDELVAPELEEELLLDDELELAVVELELPLIVPAEAVRVTRSSLAPSSRLRILKVCAPAARLLKVAGVIVA
jgi:hypothetical protein